MNMIEGARRMGHISNIMVVGSLFFIVLWFRLSVILFVGGWALYGAAHIIDGFSRTEDDQPAPTNRDPFSISPR